MKSGVAIILLFLWIPLDGLSQNNAIFNGGNSSGGDIYCHAQADAVLNNAIFGGGPASGSDMMCHLQADAVLNNAIFGGGPASGSDMFCYLQADAVLNNAIFGGGPASGSVMFCYLQADAVLNNDIFGGGQASGSVMFCYLQSDAVLNNDIFGGGQASGADVYCYLQSDAVINNSIFSGGIASGAVVSCLGDEDVALPISLIFFRAEPGQHSVILHWATANEINNDVFTVERSKDGSIWEIVTTAPGAGNSSGILHYDATDEHPYYGISYYRLKQTDFDGQYSYSDLIIVTLDVFGETRLMVYPNPTSGLLYFSTNEPDYTIQILSEDGKIIALARNPAEIDLSLLTDGLYYIRALFPNGKQIIKKLILRH